MKSTHAGDFPDCGITSTPGPHGLSIASLRNMVDGIRWTRVKQNSRLQALTSIFMKSAHLGDFSGCGVMSTPGSHALSMASPRNMVDATPPYQWLFL